MYLKILIFIFLPLFMYSNEKFEDIKVGYYSGVNSSVKYKNSRSALNIWVRDFTKNINKNVNMQVYDSRLNVIKDYLDFKLNVLAISSYDYLLNKKDIDNTTIEYWQFKKSKIKPYQKMYLIVNRDSDINTILDLKDKKIGIDIENRFGKIFFEKIYLDSSKKNADDIISKIDYNKSNSLLLKTYFAKYDAAIVSSFEYEIMLELNPAIKKKIKILKSSPEIFPHLLVLLHKDNSKKNIKLFKSTLNKFLKNENKKELFNMLKIKKITIDNKNEFNDLNEYYKDYLKLKDKFTKK